VVAVGGVPVAVGTVLVAVGVEVWVAVGGVVVAVAVWVPVAVAVEVGVVVEVATSAAGAAVTWPPPLGRAIRAAITPISARSTPNLKTFRIDIPLHS
jgi:hypothetical protein